MNLFSFIKNLFVKKVPVETPVTISPEVIEEKKSKPAVKKLKAEKAVTVEKKKRVTKKTESNG
jgi:hypothetical protein